MKKVTILKAVAASLLVSCSSPKKPAESTQNNNFYNVEQFADLQILR